MSKKITDFFSNKSNDSEGNSRGTSTPITSETSAATTSEASAATTSERSSDLANLSQRKKTDRTLKSSTLKKWISEDLAPSNAFVWLNHEENGHGQVKLMKCMVCTTFEERIKHNRDFSNAWIQGSCNLRLSNAQDHAATKCHRHAYDLYIKNLTSKGELSSNMENPLRPHPSQRTLEDGFSKLNETQLEQTIKKFDIAYFVAKNELPFTVFEDLITLEKRHGVDLGDVYNNRKQCGEFIDVNAQFIAHQLNEDLTKAKFYSVLTDGSTDNSVTEKEVVYVLYFDPHSKSNPEEVEVKLSFLCLKDVKKADAEGITSAIEQSFESLGILPNELYSKLVGFGADGASVNSGNKNGVKALLEKNAPWLVYTWCVAHKLELAVKDALNGTVFDDVGDMLTKLYSLYHKSPKKMHELKELHDLLNYEFEEGSVKPKTCFWNTMVAFKLSALRIVLDKYGVYMQHLEHLSSDKEVTDRQKLKGYLRKWKSSRMLLYVALFIDVLNPAAILSKAFQDDPIDSVGAIHNLKRSKQSLDQLMSKSFEDLPSVKHVLNKLVVTDTTCTYQGIEFPVHSFNKAAADVKASKNTVIESIHSTVDARLEGASSIELESVAKILNTEHWKLLAEVDGVEFADNMITARPLSSNYNQAILEEWHDMLSHTVNFLQSEKANYKKTWRLLFNCSYSSKWKNILLLVQLLFSVPICNAKLERLFSKLKRTKSDARCSLGEERLTNVLRIEEEGPPLGSFDASPVVQMWQSQKVRRPNQKRRKKYRARKKKVKYYHVSEKDANSDDSVDDINDVIDTTPAPPASESDNVEDMEVSNDGTDSSGSGRTAALLFSDTDSEASDFVGFLPEDL
ncbi:zinc finger 862-like [Paramuricea clavata]|uniref:Zinc finger 862-like n=1 Tax=Paramuricea clavata TaxID=317549 RepID=A0A7D9HC10_PARCT|nr:zinc finger 862-like [Paramuricea clavata]